MQNYFTTITCCSVEIIAVLLWLRGTESYLKTCNLLQLPTSWALFHLCRFSPRHANWTSRTSQNRGVCVKVSMLMFGSNMTWDRSSTHPKFDPTRVRTHGLQIMTVLFHGTEMPALTTRPSVTLGYPCVPAQTPEEDWSGYRSVTTGMTVHFTLIWPRPMSDLVIWKHRKEYGYTWMALQRPGVIKQHKPNQTCGPMSDLVIWRHRKEYGYTWHWMALLRLGINKQHKPNQSYGPMSDLVICRHRKEYGYTWHWMPLLQHKTLNSYSHFHE